jgi:hypothetical protein
LLRVRSLGPVDARRRCPELESDAVLDLLEAQTLVSVPSTSLPSVHYAIDRGSTLRKAALEWSVLRRPASASLT